MAYVEVTGSSGFGQVPVKRFRGCTLTPRFARRLTRGPRRAGLSALGGPLSQYDPGLVTAGTSLRPTSVTTTVDPWAVTGAILQDFEASRRLMETLRRVTMPVREPEPVVVVTEPVIMPVRKPEPVVVVTDPTGYDPGITPRRKSGLKPKTIFTMPVIAPVRPIAPSLYKPAVPTAVHVEKTKYSRQSPLFFKQKGIASKISPEPRAPSGATHKAIDVTVIPGADPIAMNITRAGAPVTGQTLSLQEPKPIVPVASSAHGLTLVDRPTPVQMPLVSLKPIEIQTLPGAPAVAKAGISPMMALLMAAIALPMLFMKKGTGR